MKKIILTILLIILIAGVSGGGVYLWQQNTLKNRNTENKNNESQIQNTDKKEISSDNNSTTKEITISDISFWKSLDGQASSNNNYNWKIYTSDKYNLKFRYPIDMELTDKSDSDLYLQIQSKYRAYPGYGFGLFPSLMYFRIEKTAELDKWIIQTENVCGTFQPGYRVIKQAIVSGDMKWLKYTLPLCGAEGATVYYRFDKDGDSYVFTTPFSPEDNLIYGMISSFELMK